MFTLRMRNNKQKNRKWSVRGIRYFRWTFQTTQELFGRLLSNSLCDAFAFFILLWLIDAAERIRRNSTEISKWQGKASGICHVSRLQTSIVARCSQRIDIGANCWRVTTVWVCECVRAVWCFRSCTRLFFLFCFQFYLRCVFQTHTIDRIHFTCDEKQLTSSQHPAKAFHAEGIVHQANDRNLIRLNKNSYVLIGSHLTYLRPNLFRS